MACSSNHSPQWTRPQNIGKYQGRHEKITIPSYFSDKQQCIHRTGHDFLPDNFSTANVSAPRMSLAIFSAILCPGHKDLWMGQNMSTPPREAGRFKFAVSINYPVLLATMQEAHIFPWEEFTTRTQLQADRQLYCLSNLRLSTRAGHATII